MSKGGRYVPEHRKFAKNSSDTPKTKLSVRYFDKGLLIKANNFAKKHFEKYEMDETLLNSLPNDTYFPVCLVIPETEAILRVHVTIPKKEGFKDVQNITLDIPTLLWNKLPEVNED